MTNASWIDVVLFVGLVQGVFLSINFQMIKDGNKRANRLLSLILLLTTFMMVSRIVYAHYFEKWMVPWSLFPDTTIFLIPLLIFMYLRRLLLNESVSRVFILYFIPFSAYLWMAGYFAIRDVEVFIRFEQSGALQYTFYWIEGIAIAFNILFLIYCFKTINQTERLEKQNLTFHQTALEYLKAFLTTYLLIVLLWAGVYVYFLVYGSYFQYFNYDTLWIAITVDIFLIAYYSIKQPELLRMVVTGSAQKHKPYQRIDDVKIKGLSEELNRLMNESHLFLDNELTLKTLSEQMNASANDISWLLNEVYKQSFYDYINTYRLERFKELVANQEHKTKTILALATDVGFNSKSSFNTFFKQQMDMTPSAYIKTQQSQTQLA